ncbi:MAG: hypothetical protein PVJ07_07265 [Anaerolineales bacterium]
MGFDKSQGVLYKSVLGGEAGKWLIGVIAAIEFEILETALSGAGDTLWHEREALRPNLAGKSGIRERWLHQRRRFFHLQSEEFFE